jgi:hypothetical protein
MSDYACKQGDRCVCGGDAPAVRATCTNFIPAVVQVTPLYPEMSRQEYEWLHCTVLPDNQSQTLYRHRMSGRPVLVCCKKDQQPVTIWLAAAVLTTIKARF